MCYENDARPPFHGAPITTVDAATATLASAADGALFEAFVARPGEHTGGGILVLPDNGGLRAFYEELAVKLAEQGHLAIAIDYFGRTAGTDHRARDAGFSDMSTLMGHLTRLTRAGLYGDIEAALDRLRAAGRGPLVSLGFCFGGRTAFLTAQRRFGLDGVIGLYGYPGELGPEPGPEALAAELTAPVLGLFGGADEGIPPSMVESFDRALAEAGTPHEFVTYPGAPHGFFDAGLPGFAAESADAWRRILAFAARPGPVPG